MSRPFSRLLRSYEGLCTLMAFAERLARGTVNSSVFFQSVVRAIPECEDEWQHQQLRRSLFRLKDSLETGGSPLLRCWAGCYALPRRSAI